ncbi:MAG: DUF2157 domain-containing protein [Betaproteobacteria bacterium HGW-Betaproteobacteria-13]|nr:MAG: DUF2157 domain-containing protein [Betaproteobacteria bacterium HGW-Betaproteobacteria-13]
MELNRGLLKDATAKGLITEQQAEHLWAFLLKQGSDTPSFRATHILYYLGGLIAIGAMSLFMNIGWERFGGWGLFFIALAYAGAGLWLTESFLKRHRLPIPAGITATFAVALTPLAVYGLQSALGFWADGRVFREYHTHIDWRWMLMEFATLASGVIMLWRYRLPFLVMPVAVTLWYMSMDLALFLAADADHGWALRKLVSLWFGLSSMNSDSELSKFIYLCINLIMIAVGAALSRRVFAVFGGLGAADYLAHLANEVFKDSMLFPVVLTLIGLAVVYLGIVWQRYESAISNRLRALLPAPVRELVERRN